MAESKRTRTFDLDDARARGINMKCPDCGYEMDEYIEDDYEYKGIAFIPIRFEVLVRVCTNCWTINIENAEKNQKNKKEKVVFT